MFGGLSRMSIKKQHKIFMLSDCQKDNPVPTIVTSCCTHRSGHGKACPILRAGNEPITSLLVVGDCPRPMRKEQRGFRMVQRTTD